MKRPSESRCLAVLSWIMAVAALTVVLWFLRDVLDEAHKALTYLLLVLLGSARLGRKVGLSLAVLCFLCFNFFLIPPYHTFIAEDPLDWLVLAAFIITGAVAAELLYRAQHEANAAEALREADRLKDALLASVSHDLRTPLTTIKALAQDLRVQGDERAAIIEEEADRLNRLVSDLLDLSRLDGGAVRVSPEINAVEDLLGAAIQQTSGMLGTRELRAHLDPGEPILVGRFDLIHALRALVNLIENAAKYSPPGAPVEISASRRDGWLEIVVEDRGPGIPPAERERIFQPFHRSGGTPDVGGAGLGLSIARRLAEVQGGGLLYRPREGGGSAFTLRLPAVDLAETDSL